MLAPPTTQRIHILGIGSIGNFAAHCLASLTKRPLVTLLFHRARLEEELERNKRTITLETYEGDLETAHDFDTEIFQQGHWHRTFHEPIHQIAPQTTDHISHLLVCTKTIQTVDAIRPLAGRLTAASTILLLQNGCGVVDVLNNELFKEEQNRPNYIIGVTSHGVGLNSPFSIKHTGPSATSLGAVPRAGVIPGQPNSPSLQPTQRYLLDTLCQSQRLNAKSYSFINAFQAQLEKLAVNAFCNPLCALHDSKNGFLFSLPATRRAILREISDVVLAMPELEGAPGLLERFGTEALEHTVNRVLHKTRDTTCSMVWDLRSNRKTEVEFINGYWQRRGRGLGVATPVNDMLLELIALREHGL